MTKRKYPKEVAEKLKLLLLVEKDKFERETATKTKPSKRVTLFLLNSYGRATAIGFLGSSRDWEERIKAPLE